MRVAQGSPQRASFRTPGVPCWSSYATRCHAQRMSSADHQSARPGGRRRGRRRTAEPRGKIMAQRRQDTHWDTTGDRASILRRSRVSAACHTPATANSTDSGTPRSWTKTSGSQNTRIAQASPQRASFRTAEVPCWSSYATRCHAHRMSSADQQSARTGGRRRGRRRTAEPRGQFMAQRRQDTYWDTTGDRASILCRSRGSAACHTPATANSTDSGTPRSTDLQSCEFTPEP